MHVGDNRPFSTPLSVPLAHSWHTAGHPTKLSQPLIPLLHRPPPPPPALSHSPPTECQTRRVREYEGKEALRQKKKKTLALMGRRKEEVMMGPTTPKIHLGLGRRGSVSDRQVFLSSHTNPRPAPLLRGPPGLNSCFHCSSCPDIAATLSVPAQSHFNCQVQCTKKKAVLIDQYKKEKSHTASSYLTLKVILL